jgi:hypothetical protein
MISVALFAANLGANGILLHRASSSYLKLPFLSALAINVYIFV